MTGVATPEEVEFSSQVRGMFDRIAGVYDLMNTAMTAGLHHRWRERAADRAELAPGDLALDACCGTGDLAFELARRVEPEGRVIGSDFSESMLDLARKKAADRNVASVRFEFGDALALSYDDGTFDAVTVGFGVRNLADLEGGLRELARVLRPGGTLAVLEITRPRGILKPFFRLWFDVVVPLLGRVLPGGEAYTYLPASVRRFPGPDDLSALLESAGFESVRYRLLGGGIVALHVGVKP